VGRPVDATSGSDSVLFPSPLSGRVSKIPKVHFHCLTLHIFVEKPRRIATALAFFASICKPIRQNCII